MSAPAIVRAAEGEPHLSPEPLRDGPDDTALWVARLTHRLAGGAVSYTIVGLPFESRQIAELHAQCWWSTGYGRRQVVAAHVRRQDVGREPSAQDWIPIAPGAKEACILLRAYRPRVGAAGALHLVPFRGEHSFADQD